MKKIILAEDHKIIRDGLKMLLESTGEYQIVYEAGNGQEVIDALSKNCEADMIISDICMPVMDGLSMVSILKEKDFNLPVLILSTAEDESHLCQAMAAGTRAFLTKSVNSGELFFALSKVLSGERYICSSLAMKLVDQMIDHPRLNGTQGSDFSLREIEILQLIGQGLTNSEIADKLFISRRTVEGHRQHLIEKTGARNTAVLMRFAYTNGILN